MEVVSKIGNQDCTIRGGVSMNCSYCGLLDTKVSPSYCLRLKKIVNNGSEGDHCIYFLKELYEDGERLTPQQHLLKQDQDFRSKKMQGPLR